MANKQTRLVIEHQDGTDRMAEILDAFDHLVIKIVNSRWGFNEDLYQEGRIAVIEAVPNFSRDRGEFSTFVFHRITAAVNAAGPAEHYCGPRVPWTTFSRYRKILRLAQDDLELALSIAPDEGMSADTFIEVSHAVGNTTNDFAEVEEMTAGTPTLSSESIDEFLECLGPDRSLFVMFYGVHDGYRRSAKELAKLKGCTETDIRVTIERCRRKLKSRLKSEA